MSETPADTMRRAAARLGTYPVMDDRVAVPLAAVFERWAWMVSMDPDLLNRVGGQETLALARAVLGEEAGR